jgi:hypothetical protein
VLPSFRRSAIRHTPASMLAITEWHTLDTAQGAAVKGLGKFCVASTTPRTEFCKKSAEVFNN